MICRLAAMSVLRCCPQILAAVVVVAVTTTPYNALAQTNQERIRQLEAERRVLENEEAVARSRGADLEIERQQAAAAVAKAIRDYENYTGEPAPAALPVAKGVAASLGMFPSRAAAQAALAGRPVRVGQHIDEIPMMGRKLYRAIIGIFQNDAAVTAYCKAQAINCVIVR